MDEAFWDRWGHVNLGGRMRGRILTIEDLYQAFKARLTAEKDSYAPTNYGGPILPLVMRPSPPDMAVRGQAISGAALREEMRGVAAGRICQHCHTPRDPDDDVPCCDRANVDRLEGLLRRSVDVIEQLSRHNGDQTSANALLADIDGALDAG